MTQRKIDVNPLNSLTSIIVAIVFFVLVFYLLKGLFNILWFLSPALIIVAAILNPNVIVDYGKMLWNLLKKNPLMGVAGIVLTVVCFPVVSAFLAGKAWLYRKLDNLKTEMGGEPAYSEPEYAEYEEIESTTPSPGSVELPPIELQKPKEKQTEYDELFEDDA